MRCPQCAAENSDDVKVCGACGQKLGRPARVRQTPNPDPWNGTEPIHFAYRCSFWALFPPLGLLFAPLALLSACYARWQTPAALWAQKKHLFRFILWFAGLVALTQWVGVYLMWQGW